VTAIEASSHAGFMVFKLDLNKLQLKSAPQTR
jgi:hypothetical protein